MDIFNSSNEMSEEEKKEIEAKKQALRNTTLYSVKEFQALVLKGEITDSTGVATVVINGVPTNFNVYIDRHCVTKGDGSLVTYAGFMKQYKSDTVEVLYQKKNRPLLSHSQFLELHRK